MEVEDLLEDLEHQRLHQVSHVVLASRNLVRFAQVNRRKGTGDVFAVARALVAYETSRATDAVSGVWLIGREAFVEEFVFVDALVHHLLFNDFEDALLVHLLRFFRLLLPGHILHQPGEVVALSVDGAQVRSNPQFLQGSALACVRLIGLAALEGHVVLIFGFTTSLTGHLFGLLVKDLLYQILKPAALFLFCNGLLLLLLGFGPASGTIITTGAGGGVGVVDVVRAAEGSGEDMTEEVDSRSLASESLKECMHHVLQRLVLKAHLSECIFSEVPSADGHFTKLDEGA